MDRDHLIEAIQDLIAEAETELKYNPEEEVKFREYLKGRIGAFRECRKLLENPTG